MSYFWNLQEQARKMRHGGRGANLSAEARSIRLRGPAAGGKISNVTIRVVETGEKIRAACDLINDRYVWRGYGGNHQILSDAYHLTFTAESHDEVVGTITLATDSPAGLAADRAFREELDTFRAQPGAKICELTKFAFDSQVHSQELMATLFHIVFVYGHRSYGCTDLFIEVNPRHVRFYETMLGFERVGPVKQNESVAAPAQLMWLKVAKIREQIDAVAGKPDQANHRSLYRLFFSPTEENGIYERLVAAKAVPAACDREAKPSPVRVREPSRLIPRSMPQRERVLEPA